MGLVVLGVGVIAFIALIGQCSSPPATTDAASANLMDANISAGIAAQAPPSVEPLNKASVARGIAHFRLAHSAEAFPGAMIYSQNCYDALTHKFSWAKLDACGAFDMLATRAILDADVSSLDNEVAYFQSETAAGRYLAAATGAGEEAAEADKRLSDLQAKAARAPSPVPTTKTTEPALESDNVTIANLANPAEVEDTVEPAEMEDTDV